MKVNELAKSVGVTSNTVRYYTKIGLLKPVRDPTNGYKLYRQDDVHKLTFTLQAKELGFTLNHIKELLTRVNQGESVCALVREKIEVNIKDCEAEISRLSDLKNRMESALQRWKTLPNEAPNTNIWCHLIES